MVVVVVADASVFITGKSLKGEIITVPAVERELKDIRSKSRLQVSDVRVESPSADALKKARSAAKATGDILVLSQTDLDVLAKAVEYKATLATDDYAIQNVALHLGLRLVPVSQPLIKKRMRRVQRCRACGRAFDGEACPDCGTPRKGIRR
jgi:UPF0271 protein